MNEMQIFDNPEFGSVRTLVIEDDPWFVGKDVAIALGYKDSTNALKSRVKPQHKKRWQITTPSRGLQTATIIDEPGLYAIVFGSKAENAERFQDWVYTEVLPALRKTGSYTVPDATSERPLTRDDYLNAARILAGCRNERLPMVVDMLGKAGLDMEQIKAPAVIEADPKITEYEQEKLRATLSQYTDMYVAQKIGVSRSLITKYRHGDYIPRRSRYQFILDTLEKEEETE